MGRRKVKELYHAVVLLTKLLRRWHMIASARKAMRFRKSVYLRLGSESAEEIVPSDVPKGHVPVYVGATRSRFIIPVTYLNDLVFRQLLEKAEKEFGFDNGIGLSVPCDETQFEYLISLL
uniref:TSA: Wollemia nobilis Ref_Wollemi_Transcript_18592_508 transcribed RNA sequence n=1 Tax=Wollemia nobilis TaxID=56998 RepID=A0A0C9QNE9_9CONI